MVKVTKALAAANAAHVLNAAGRAMRAQGTAAATVAEIAAMAGLTHGAVYRHFETKDALAAAAITADFEQIVKLLAGLGQQGSGAAGYINTYLGTDHRDHFDWGCPIAPLAAEIQRDVPEVQAAFCKGLRRNIEALRALLGRGKTYEDATVMLATLSGAMALARATRQQDPTFSEQILAATRSTLLEQIASSEVSQDLRHL